MSDTCDRCHRQKPSSNPFRIGAVEPTCYRKDKPAGGWATPEQEQYEFDQVWACEQARTAWFEARVAMLEAELAEARKPRWIGPDLTVLSRKVVASVRLQANGTGWRYFGIGLGEAVRGYNTQAEAKAAAEKAYSVEVSDVG